MRVTPKQNKLDKFDLSYDDKRNCIGPSFLSVAESLKIGLCKEIQRLKRFDQYDQSDKKNIIKSVPGLHKCTIRNGRTIELLNPQLNAAGFEELLKPFLDRDLTYARVTEYRMTCSIFVPLEDALGRCGLDSEQINCCLLVGGSSLIPQVQEAVQRYFSSAEILKFDDADAIQTAIARGAAYHALSLSLLGKGVVQPVTGSSISIKTLSGPIELIPQSVILPYPQNEEWIENTDLTISETSLTEILKMRVELIDEERCCLGATVWNIKPPVNLGDRLRVRYRMDENQTLHLQMQRLNNPENSDFQYSIENPLTFVGNTNTKRAQIDEMEEKLRTEMIEQSEKLEIIEKIADLYDELGQREKALELYRKLLANSQSLPISLLVQNGTHLR